MYTPRANLKRIKRLFQYLTVANWPVKVEASDRKQEISRMKAISKCVLILHCKSTISYQIVRSLTQFETEMLAQSGH